ncbi:MAG: bifunctional enoyl-CoA hydratase/phosphate acetyltransferase [Firmicutes bacterium]|jgi:phosphate butyryltransferase|nr:bifunctional enoyl-CoA hydratase/phosphate acetyltransferase [Bacillota bacterium]
MNDWKGIVEAARGGPRQRIAVAVAQDEDVLQSLDAAADFTASILVGDKTKIARLLEKLEVSFRPLDIVDEPDVTRCCNAAVEMIVRGEADLLMKGLVPTADLLRAVLNSNMRKGRILSHVAVFSCARYHKMFILTDAGICIAPGFEEKREIALNAVSVARALGIGTPKVAALSAIEVVNPAMPSTLDAALLAKAAGRGQIPGAVVDGPLAFDNAISREAALHKRITSEVAGDADILLCPNIETGNALYKCLTYLAGAEVGSVVAGASRPIVLTSRADDAGAKLRSIALACFLSRKWSETVG